MDPQASQNPIPTPSGVLPEGALPCLAQDTDPEETAEWLDAFDWVVRTGGCERAGFLLERLRQQAFRCGVQAPLSATTPYVNTIPPEQEPAYHC